MKHGVAGLMLVCACLAAEAPLGEQLGPQLQCPTPKTTNVKIVLRTQQNQTGHWVSRVAVKQGMVSAGGEETNLWDVDVEQNSESCDDEGSVLETVFYLSAPTAMRGQRPSPAPVSTQPSQWVCPNSPSHPSPSPPLPPPCGSCPPPSPAPTLPSPKTIPRGYTRYLGVGFFKFHTKAATWVEAKEICEEEGGHLAVINSDQEASVLESMMNQYPTATDSPSNNAYVYVGVQKIGKVFYTVLGEELSQTGYALWMPNEPSGGNEFCLSLARPVPRFNDVPCGYKLAFICEHA